MAKKGEVEVGAKLMLDDAATAVLGKIKGSFDSLNDTVEKSIHKVLDFGRDVAAIAIGVQLGDVIGNIREIGRTAFDEATRGTEQMRELSKTIAGLATHRGGNNFARDAQAQYDSFTKLSRAAMVSRDDMVGAFVETSKSTILSREQLEKFIGKVAMASRALPGTITEVATGFEQFRKNVISADNPLITMIKQANLLRGHSEQIALRLQMMGRPAALAMANKALAIMQERAKGLGPTFGDLQIQLEQTKTDLLRIIGQPMLAAVTPQFQRFQQLITEHRDEIEKYAKLMGKQVGVWVTEAAKLIERGFAYLKAHGDQIKKSIVEAWTFAKKVVDFIYSHRKELAIGMVAAKAATLGGATPEMAGGALLGLGRVIAATNLSGTMKQLVVNMKSWDLILMGAKLQMKEFVANLDPAAKGLGALALAVAGVALAINQWQKLMKEMRPETSVGDAEAKLAALRAAAEHPGGFSVGRIADMAKIVREHAGELGVTVDEINKLAAAATKTTVAIRDAATGFETASQLAPAQMLAAATAFRDAYGSADDATSDAINRAAANVLSKSPKLQAAVLTWGSELGIDMEHLGDQLSEKLPEFSKKLKATREREKKDAGAKGALMPLNVFNGNIWQIKQDFRDQDPDRVLTTFQRDIASAAENRLQARTALPFGG